MFKILTSMRMWKVPKYTVPFPKEQSLVESQVYTEIKQIDPSSQFTLFQILFPQVLIVFPKANPEKGTCVGALPLPEKN